MPIFNRKGNDRGQQHADQLEELSRRMDKAEARGTRSPASTRVEFDSLGAFVKSLVDESRDHAADAELITRLYSGATFGDTGNAPAFVQKDIKLVQENRPLASIFDQQPLPKTGNAVTYPRFDSKSGDVAEQANEGDDLAYLELVVTDGTATVKTYGGYSELSVQAIERADVPYLDKVLRMQKISYAKATNGAVRAALGAMSGTNTLTIPLGATATDWTTAAIDGLSAIELNSLGLTGNVWVMPLAQYRQLAGLVDTEKRPIFLIGGGRGANTLGNLDLRGIRANVSNLPVFVDPKLAANTSYIASREALTLREDGPFNLTDQNVINLSEAFSIYGYAAIETNDAKGVTKITHAAA